MKRFGLIVMLLTSLAALLTYSVYAIYVQTPSGVPNSLKLYRQRINAMLASSFNSQTFSGVCAHGDIPQRR